MHPYRAPPPAPPPPLLQPPRPERPAAGPAGAAMVRLLATVLAPGICEASAEASERAASLLTEPFSVTMPFWTELWMGALLSALSPLSRVCTAVVSAASSTAGAAVLL